MNTLTEEARAELRRQANQSLVNYRVHGPEGMTIDQHRVIIGHLELVALLDAAAARDRLAEEVKRYKALAHDLTGMTWADRARKERERAEHAEMEVAALCGGDYDLLRALLAEAVTLFEMDDECNWPGSDSWRWIQNAREALDTNRAGQQEGNGND